MPHKSLPNRCHGHYEPAHDTARAVGVIEYPDGHQKHFCPVCLIDYATDPNVSADDRKIAQIVMDALAPFDVRLR